MLCICISTAPTTVRQRSVWRRGRVFAENSPTEGAGGHLDLRVEIWDCSKVWFIVGLREANANG